MFFSSPYFRLVIKVSRLRTAKKKKLALKGAAPYVLYCDNVDISSSSSTLARQPASGLGLFSSSPRDILTPASLLHPLIFSSKEESFLFLSSRLICGLPTIFFHDYGYLTQPVNLSNLSSLLSTIYLPTYLPICLSIHPSIHPSIYLSVYLPTYLPICLPICLSIYLSIYLSLYLSN